MLMLLVMSCIGLLASCDGGDIEAHNRPLTVVDDQALAAGSSDLLALKLSDWTGVSASGETVDVEITYSADLPAQWFDKSKILLRVQLLPVAGGVPYSARSVEVLAGQN